MGCFAIESFQLTFLGFETIKVTCRDETGDIHAMHIYIGDNNVSQITSDIVAKYYLTNV